MVSTYNKLRDAQYLLEVTVSNGKETSHPFDYSKDEPDPHGLVPDGWELVRYRITPLDGSAMFW